MITIYASCAPNFVPWVTPNQALKSPGILDMRIVAVIQDRILCKRKIKRFCCLDEIIDKIYAEIIIIFTIARRMNFFLNY